MSFDSFILNLAQTINYFPLWAILIFVFVSACIQQVFPPYPSEVLLLLLGCLAAAGLIPGLPVIAIYVIGTILSSLLIFEISHRSGKDILKTKFVKKVFPRKYQRRAGLYVRKYGILAMIICKFIPGVNSVCLIMGGIMGLKGPLAMLVIGVTGAVANVVYFAAGSVIGKNIPALYDFARQFSIIMGIAAGLIAASIIALIFVQKFTRAQRRAKRRMQNS